MTPNNTPSPPLVERGVWWVVAQFILMASVLVLGVWFPGLEKSGWLRFSGVLLVLLSAYWGIGGVLVLGRNRTPFPQPRSDSELVQQGIYAHLRHPLYASVLLGSLGWALWWQSGASALAALALWPFFEAKARCEERRLRKMFPAYTAYAQRVPRFIPRFRRTKN